MTAVEELTRALQDAYSRGDWKRARELWHPDALIAGIASGRKPLSPEDTIKSVERARKTGIYSFTRGRIVPLDESAVLSEGRCRYRHPDGGHADSPVYWVHTFVDGRLYRTGVYSSADKARAAYATDGVSLGFTEPAAYTPSRLRPRRSVWSR